MSISSLFKGGYGAVDQIDAEMQEKAEQRKKGYAPTFMLKQDEKRRITLLTEFPQTYKEHYLPANSKGNQFKICTAGARDENGKALGCKYCDSGVKQTNRGAFLIIDHTADSWVDKQGIKVTKSNQIKIWKAGIRPLRGMGALAKLKAEMGESLLEYSLIIQKVGQGTETNNAIFAEKPVKISEETKAEIAAFLGDMTPEEKLIDLLSPVPEKTSATVTSEAVEYESEEDSTMRPDFD